MREWHVGDVAIRTWDGIYPQRAIVAEGCGVEFHDVGPHWHIEEHGWDPIDVEERQPKAEFRPLVVIDPEDRVQVAQLMGHFSRADGRIFGGAGVTDMQAALREIANPTPPKPDEPTGLGAVVEDADGERWVRDEEGSENTQRVWYRKGYGSCRKYADLAAVRVLSEGVTS